MSNTDDLEERFRQLEREVANQFEPPMKSADPFKVNFDQSPEPVRSGFYGLISWINGLTGVTKILAIAGLGLVVFAVVRFLVNLVAAAVSLALMLGIVFILYKLFFTPKLPE